MRSTKCGRLKCLGSAKLRFKKCADTDWKKSRIRRRRRFSEGRDEIRGRVSRSGINHKGRRRDPPSGRSQPTLQVNGSLRRAYTRNLPLRTERRSAAEYRVDS